MVWLNGAFLGASKDSRLPAEFEVTERLQHGKNLLAVQVRCGACVTGKREQQACKRMRCRALLQSLAWPADVHPSIRPSIHPSTQVIRWTDSTYLEDQDMWRLSGLHRDVLLLSKPSAASIADFAVRTPLAWTDGGAGGAKSGASLSEARLEVDVKLEVVGAAGGVGEEGRVAAKAMEGLRVIAHLYDERGNRVVERPLECSLQEVRGPWARGVVFWGVLRA